MKIEKLNSLSNSVYLVDGMFTYRKDNEFFNKDKTNEEKITNLLYENNLTVKTFFGNGFKISEYKKEIEISDNERFLRQKIFLDKMHKLKTDIVFDPVKLALEYIPNKYFQIIEKIIDIDKTVNKDSLCHCDPIKRNFLVTENSCYLIDFEYSGIYDPKFDDASMVIDYNIKKCYNLTKHIKLVALLWLAWSIGYVDKLGKEFLDNIFFYNGILNKCGLNEFDGICREYSNKYSK